MNLRCLGRGGDLFDRQIDHCGKGGHLLGLCARWVDFGAGPIPLTSRGDRLSDSSKRAACGGCWFTMTALGTGTSLLIRTLEL
jgi:hypothetical protein